MVWIHGGGNSAGKASDFIPDKYMEEDVVLVVIQYRLGPLGTVRKYYYDIKLIFLLIQFFNRMVEFCY